MPEPEDGARLKAHFGFRSNPMDKLFMSHGGLSSLCFDRTAFFEDSFDVDIFLSSHTQRGIPLEVLKDDLATYRKILQSALVQLIDREYADFVHLSSSLVGIDKNVEKLKFPVEAHLSQVQKCVEDVAKHVQAVDAKIYRRMEAERSRKLLKSLLSCMDCMETLLHVERKLSDTESVQARLPLLYRTSDLLCRVYREECSISSTAWYTSIRERLTIVDSAFAKVLGDDLLVAVRSSEAQQIEDYCIIYRHLDRLNVAYRVVSEGAIKPVLCAIIRGLQLQTSSLSEVFSSLYSTVEEKFYSMVYVDQAEFILESLWSSLSDLLIDGARGYFIPDQADEFQKHYRASKQFMTDFVRLFSRVQPDLPSRFWQHPASINLLEKWSLPIYYQVRFLEIGTPVEQAFSGDGSLVEINDGEEGFRLQATKSLWQAVQRCWEEDVCLEELIHRFWKLTLLLFARYRSWLGGVFLDGDQSRLVSLTLRDLALLDEKIPLLPTELVARFLPDDQARSSVLANLSESLQDTLRSFRAVEEQLLQTMAAGVAAEITDVLKSLQDVPRLYRRTNREPPTVHSAYVDSAFDLLSKRLHTEARLSQRQLDVSLQETLSQVVKNYAGFVSDLLDAVRRMEDSLKKLKKTRFAAETSAVMSDDDKIRLQLVHDVLQMERRIALLGLSPEVFEEFGAAKKRVLLEKPER